MIHLKGSRDGEKGHTKVLSPLPTPHRLHQILALTHPMHAHSEMYNVKYEWMRGKDKGPNFFNYEKVLPTVNRVLRMLNSSKDIHTLFPKDMNSVDWEWLSKVKAIEGRLAQLLPAQHSPDFEDIRYINITPIPCNGPYLAIWPVGVPHGTDNSGDSMRFTLTVPVLSTTSPNFTERRTRAINRLTEIAEEKFNDIAKDAKVWAGGSTHRCPSTEVTTLLPHFRSMFVKSVDDFSAAFAL